nr:13902_t:CDS:1 [Entrophospora candida]
MLENPWVLLNKDFHWIASHSYEMIVEFILRNSIFAIRYNKDEPKNEPTSELDISYWRNCSTILTQTMLTLITFPIFIFYPLLMMKSLEVEEIRKPEDDTYYEEKWFFINGVMTNTNWLDLNCKYLESRFGRGVTGILNRSYGIVWDLIESILHRNFEVDTMSVRWATNRILPVLKDENIKIVRMVSHSQGAIIANLVMKRLYIELSNTEQQDYLRKLEVYTFANPSRKFINPGKLVSRIEHYANDQDPVAMIGVLSEIGKQHFHGEVFINNKKGHLFNSFYSLNKEDYKPVTDNTIPTFLELPGIVKNLPI